MCVCVAFWFEVAYCVHSVIYRCVYTIHACRVVYVELTDRRGVSTGTQFGVPIETLQFLLGLRYQGQVGIATWWQRFKSAKSSETFATVLALVDRSVGDDDSKAALAVGILRTVTTISFVTRAHHRRRS